MTDYEIRCVYERAYDDAEKDRHMHGLRAVERAAAERMREACAALCEARVLDEIATGKVDHNEMAWTQWCAMAIRALKIEVNDAER